METTPKYEGGIDFNNGEVVKDPNDPLEKTKSRIVELTNNIEDLENQKKSLVELVTKIELEISQNPEKGSGVTKKILEESRQNILAINNQIRISGEDLVEYNTTLGRMLDEQYVAGGVLKEGELSATVANIGDIHRLG